MTRIPILSDEQFEALAQIVEAERARPPLRALADRWGVPRTLLANWLFKLRHGWACQVRYTRCCICSGPICCQAVGGIGKTAHAACRPQRAAAHNTRYRLKGGAALRRHQAEQARGYHDPARNAAGLEDFHIYTVEQQADSLDAAYARGTPWSADDLALLIEHPLMPVREAAERLGRSYYGVSGMRRRLIAAGHIPNGINARTKP